MMTMNEVDGWKRQHVGSNQIGLVGRKSSVAQRKAWNDDDKPSSSSSSAAAANGPTKNRPPLSNGPGSPSPSSSSAAALTSSAGRKIPLLPRDVRSQLEEISGWPASPYRTRQLKACLAQLPVDNLYITHWLVTSRFINAANVPFFSKLLSVKPAALQAIVDEADLLFH